MHDLEPFYNWRNFYIASEDDRSPFHERVYSETHYTERIYNQVIHPQWDNMGSTTLFVVSSPITRSGTPSSSSSESGTTRCSMTS